ncbi:MAG: 50S ribosomal protein L4 [Planctomycetota bacterium]|jgi:large subunit ribosomal protein L4
MLEVPVYNPSGEKIETMTLDEDAFGGKVNAALLKQAIVSYHANRHRGTAATKSRGMVRGSTRKVFRQKGTGYARRGSIRTNILRGGSVAFAKVARQSVKTLPKKMRKAALKSAILAKILGDDFLILKGLGFDAPKTKAMAGVLKNLKIDRSCLLALAQRDGNVYLSSRNIPDLTVRIAEELNAFDVASRQKMIVTAEAMQALLGEENRRQDKPSKKRKERQA